MRLTKPRVQPANLDDASEAQREILAPRMNAEGRVLNVFRTLAQAPAAASKFMVYGSYILSDDNPLPAREREIVILRTGFLCRSGYEWTQHVRVGKRAGLTDAEIAAIKVGTEDPGWSAADAALIRAADELVGDHFISDETWARLRAHFSEEQVVAVIFTCGQYTQVSMFLNSCGVQLDEGQTLDPDLKAY